MNQAAIGFDIGGTNSAIGLVTDSGEVLAQVSIDTSGYWLVTEFVSQSTAAIRKLLNENADYELKGIGIGVPNGNYYSGTVEFAPNLPWKGTIPFRNLFREHFDVPVVLTNDANAAAIGEMIYGAARKMNDFIVVTLGTGLGSGFVANGKLIYGHDGFAGELGHVIAVRDGRPCGCGRKGCLEQYASATGIVITVKKLLEDTGDPTIFRNKTDFTSKDIYEAAVAGDTIAMKAFDFTAKILGRSLADAVAITSPEAIILFGGLANAGDLLIKPAKAYMEESMLDVFRNKVKLLESSIPGNNAAVLGASALVWSEINGGSAGL